jgi:hypothetical protein
MLRKFPAEAKVKNGEIKNIFVAFENRSIIWLGCLGD